MAESSRRGYVVAVYTSIHFADSGWRGDLYGAVQGGRAEDRVSGNAAGGDFDCVHGRDDVHGAAGYACEGHSG